MPGTPTTLRFTRSRAFTLVEMIAVIVVIALLIGLAAFGYTRFIAGSKSSTAKAIASQVAKAIQGHSATGQHPYGEAVYGDEDTDGSSPGTHPAPVVVDGDLQKGAWVSGMVDDPEGDGAAVSIIVVHYSGYAVTVEYDTGEIGTPGRLSDVGESDESSVKRPKNVTASATVTGQAGGTSVTVTWTGAASIDSYEVYLGDGDTPAWTGMGTSSVITGVPAGTYTVRVVALQGAEKSAPGTATVEVPIFNDHFADAWVLPTPEAGTDHHTGRVASLGSTRETGEPGGVDRTVWWTFTPTADAAYTLRVADPEVGPKISTHRIQIYTGDSASTLTAVAASPEAANATVQWFATAGTTYRIRIGNRPYASYPAGWFDLVLTRPAANDAFATPAELPAPEPSQTTTTGDVTNLGSGTDPGEPTGVHRTLWWTFTPTANASYKIRVANPDSGAKIASNYVHVYTGDAVNSLTLVAGSPYADNAEVEFFGTANTTYRVRVGNYPYPQYQAGRFQLTVQRGAANDAFTSPDVLEVPGPLQTTTTGDVSNLGTGTDPGEPTGVHRTVWWTFTPTADGTYTLRVADPETGTKLEDNYLHVYTGGAVNSLTLVAGSPYADNAQVQFLGRAGTTYRVRVGNYPYPAYHAGWFQLTVQRGPTNDLFADAATIPSGSGVWNSGDVSNVGSGKETGEPGGDRSVWWVYEAAASGTARLRTLDPTAGAKIDYHFVSVLTGSAVSSLTGVAHVYDQLNADFTFPVIAGQRYYVQVTNRPYPQYTPGTFQLELTRP